MSMSSDIVDKRKDFLMSAVHVFDPAMCCSTGICGPSVDPQLVRFAADLDWLKSQGVAVERFNLSQQPAAFAADAEVKSALESKGEAGLPLVKVNGEVKSSGTYPSRDELATWAGIGASMPSLSTEAGAASRQQPETKQEPACCTPSTQGASSAPNKVSCC